MDFNYEKAYFVWVLSEWKNLNKPSKGVHNDLLPFVKDLNQGEGLNIPMSDEIKVLLNCLSIEELAVLSRLSYFAGHWKPGKVKPLFDNSTGQAWKISNLCDQILKEKLDLPHNVQVHEGVLRVTYSSPDCWMWEEFGLATEENLKMFWGFKAKHSFGEATLEKSAKKLRRIINNLWENVDDEVDTEEYQEFLKDKQQ